MRVPSRHMPPIRAPKAGPLLWVFLATPVFALAYLGYSHPVVTGLALAAFALIAYSTAISVRNDRSKLAGLALSRPGESICEFARSFETRNVDTWVIRAVYEQFQEELSDVHPGFPLRANDRIKEDLLADPDTLDMHIARAIAARTGRSIDDVDGNPYLGKVRTLDDLVFFFNAQPRKRTS